MAKTEIEMMAQKLATGKASVTEIPAAKKLAKASSPELANIDDAEWRKPRICIDSDSYPGFKKREAGEKVVLLVECMVKYSSSHERTENGKKESGYNMDLVVENMAEVD